ncbi:hypothetical protein RFI_35085 [Reticulomyxa filosa]|uniref:SIS domain-containing protein n=1 Tax=Reticulomyxa filosa TaxID=46433 RepID=X6LMI5_RETFI|nr:hypothetical protein RFI_35085 [Reticulomyxa filosa]|eukprot:ETO02352.1 hypothetical protein RFI_35085 [Reticulomyxa filosa]
MFNEELIKHGLKECCEYCIAGGDQALLSSQERPEDDPIQGVKDLKALTEGARQVLYIGITCGLSAPYVGGQVEYAMQQDNFVTVLMGFNPSHMARDQPVEKWQGKTFKQLCETLAAISPTPGHCQSQPKNAKHILLNPVIGPETITGSTRMKSGTATIILLQSILIGALSKALSTQTTEDEVKSKPEQSQSGDDDYNHVWNLLSLFDSTIRNTYRTNVCLEMAKGMRAISNALLNDGRVIYVGNQVFSGISTLIDSSEMKPTFGTENERYRTYLPEGWSFLRTRSGDISERGSVYNIDLKNIEWNELKNNDVVVFVNNEKSDVWALAKKSKAQLIHVHVGADTVQLQQSEASAKLLLKLEKSDIARTGINNKLTTLLLESMEVLSAKLLLNGLSTGGHVLSGHVYSNRMINVRAANDKLFYRAVFLVQDLGQVSFTQAQECLLQAAYGDAVWKDYITSPVSTHVQNIAKLNKVVPIAIGLACFNRLNNPKSVEDIQHILANEPCLRKVLKKFLSL